MNNSISEVKAKYGQSAKDIIISGLGLTAKGKKYRCPNTVAHKNGDRNPSMSWDDSALQFHCFTCNMNIDIYGYFREHLNYSHAEIMEDVFGTAKKIQTEREKFIIASKDISNITKKSRDYINRRKIKDETIEKFGILSLNDNIVFPYYKYETIIGYKCRNLDRDKKMWAIQGSKPFLFNFQNLEDFENELIICEGEFDCMVLYQCGFKNVVSVGAGANSISLLLEQCGDMLHKYNNLIIVSDNDEAGTKMDEAFLKEFNTKARLIDKSLYSKKDINEEYYVFGKSKIEEIIESARLKIEGRRDLDIKPYKGITKRPGKYIPTGINKLDYAINQLAPGCVTILVGRTNSGKTTFAKQIIANAIDKDNKVFCVSGEGDQEIFINELYANVIGGNKNYYNVKKVNIRDAKEPTPEALRALKQWHKGKLVIFNKGESRLRTTDELFNMIAYEIKINRHNLVLIDNMMSLLMMSGKEDRNSAQGDFMQRCCDIAQAYNTHIIVVVHTRKDALGRKSIIEIENISGNMDIGNKADNIISITRRYKDDESEEEYVPGGTIKLLKNRYFKELPEIETVLDDETGLLLSRENGTANHSYRFGWEKYLDNISVDFVEATQQEMDMWGE